MGWGVCCVDEGYMSVWVALHARKVGGGGQVCGKICTHYFEKDFEIQAMTSVELCMPIGASFIDRDQFSRLQEF